MTADFGFVVHAAQGDTDVFPAQRPCYALAQGGLTHAGRAPQTQDGRTHVPLQFQDCQVFDDAVFHAVQAEMVFVQHLLRMLEVQVVVGQFAPGQVQHKLDVLELDAVVRRGGIELLQAGHFLVEDGAHFLGPLLFIGPAAHFLELLTFVHTQFFLDGAQLVVQVILALLLVDVRFHLLVDFLLDLQQLGLGFQHLQQGQATLVDVRERQQGRTFGKILHLDGGGDKIHQEMEVFDAAQRADGLLGGEGRRLDHQAGLFLQAVGQDADFALVGIGRNAFLQITHTAHQIGLIGNHLLQMGQGTALQDGRHGAVRHFQRLDELAGGAVGAQVGLGGILHGNVSLREGCQPAVTGLHILHQLHGFLTAHRYREHGSGENNGVSQRQDGDARRKIGHVHLHGHGIPYYRHNVHLRMDLTYLVYFSYFLPICHIKWVQ